MAITPEERAMMESYYNQATAAPPASAPTESTSQGFWSDLGNAANLAVKQRALGLAQLAGDAMGTTAPGDLMSELSQQYKDQHRGNQNDIVYNSAGDMVGSVLGDPLSYALAGGAPKKMLGMAATGLGYGVASGATTPLAEGDSRIANTAIQGAIGAFLGPVVGKTAQGIGYLGGKAVDALMPDTVPFNTQTAEAAIKAGAPVVDTTINVGSNLPADIANATKSAGKDISSGFINNKTKNLPPEQAARAALFLKQNVPYSAGDVTKDVAQQGLEDMALKGAYGPEAQAMASAFRESQQTALAEAAQSTAKTIGKGNAIAGNEADIASGIQETARKAADSAWVDVGKAYDKVQRSGAAAIPTSAFNPLKQTIKQVKLDYPVEALPKANAAVTRLQSFFDNNPEKSVLNYKHADNFRKFLGNAYASSTDDAERAVLGILKSKVAQINDDAVEQGLIIGNPNTLKQLKVATGVAKDYFSRFEDNKIVDTIIRKDMTPESVISMTLGYGQLGAKKEAASTINAIKTVIGADAPEFQQLKQAGLFRILGTDLKSYAKDGLSGIKPATNLDTLIKTNQSLWKALYTPEEQAAITDLVTLVKEATVKQPGAVNNSGTAPALMRHMNSLLGKFGMGGNYVSGLVNKVTGLAEKQRVTDNLTQSFSGNIATPSLSAALSGRIGSQAGPVAGVSAVNSLINRPAEPAKPSTLTPEERQLIEQYFNNQGGADASSPAPDNTAPFSPPAPVMQESPQSSIMPEIQKAAEISGIDAEFLNKIASRESSLNPDATNPDSTATGLFQITNKTWRGLVKKYGKEYGIGYSDRKNPEANAIMAGLLTKENTARLAKRIGYAPSEPEIYMAHFLGDYAASKLIKNKSSTNAASALFPDAARVNRTVFYHNNGKGKPLTAAELYNKLAYSIS